MRYMSPSSFNHAILNHVMRLWICVGITFLDSHFEQPLRLNKRLVVVSLSKIVQQILGKRAFNEVKDLFSSRLDSYFSKPTNQRTEPPNPARSLGTSPLPVRPSVRPSISSPSSVLPRIGFGLGSAPTRHSPDSPCSLAGVKCATLLQSTTLPRRV